MSNGNKKQFSRSTALIWIVSIIGFMVVVNGSAYLLFQYYQHQMQASHRQETMPGRLQKPPAPILESAVGEDLKKLRDHEEQVLNSYTWIDRSKGIVRIPIDRAIDLMVEEHQSEQKQDTLKNVEEK